MRANQEGWQERFEQALVKLPAVAPELSSGSPTRSPCRTRRAPSTAENEARRLASYNAGFGPRMPATRSPARRHPAERGRAEGRPRRHRRQPERLHPRDREVQAARRRRREGAGPPHPAGRPGGAEAAGGGQPPLRGLLRQALPRPGPLVPRPDPRGQPGPDRGGQALRSRAQRQVHLLRGLVGAPGHLPRALRARPGLPPAPEALGPGLARSAAPATRLAAELERPPTTAGAGQGDRSSPRREVEDAAHGRGDDVSLSDRGGRGRQHWSSATRSSRRRSRPWSWS